MSLEKNKSHYSKLAKIFHWGFVFLFIYGVAKQVDDISQLQDNDFFRFEITFALIFLFLLVTRFIYMKTTQKTSIPEDTPKIQKIAAKIVHNGMYLLLEQLFYQDYLLGVYFGWVLKWYILNILIAIHELVINLLYLLIGIHIIAATYRLKRDGVWASMVPF